MTSDATLTLVTRRIIKGPRARVFDAWTDPARLQKWWGPKGVACIGADVDLQVGGAYRIGNRFPDGRVVWIAGTYEEITPPQKLVFRWSIEGAAGPVERVSVSFLAAGDYRMTEVVVTHERISDAATRDQHAAGWEGCLDGLERLFDRER